MLNPLSTVATDIPCQPHTRSVNCRAYTHTRPYKRTQRGVRLSPHGQCQRPLEYIARFTFRGAGEAWHTDQDQGACCGSCNSRLPRNSSSRATSHWDMRSPRRSSPVSRCSTKVMSHMPLLLAPCLTVSLLWNVQWFVRQGGINLLYCSYSLLKWNVLRRPREQGQVIRRTAPRWP